MWGGRPHDRLSCRLRSHAVELPMAFSTASTCHDESYESFISSKTVINNELYGVTNRQQIISKWRTKICRFLFELWSVGCVHTGQGASHVGMQRAEFETLMC